MLRAHYRSPIEVTKATTDDAGAALERLDAFARSLAEADLPTLAADPEALERFRAAMDDDLDTPRVVALLFDLRAAGPTRPWPARTSTRRRRWARPSSRSPARSGLVLDAGGAEVPESVLAIARQRDEARAAKDWARADALRDELVADGWVVEDTAAGTQVRPA